MNAILQDLEHSLENYIAWCTRRDIFARPQLERWAAEILRRCKLNWEREASNLRPECNNDATAQIRAAHRLLVFVPDDRAQYALHAICRRWYKKTVAEHLQQSQVYAPASKSCAQVMAEVQQYMVDSGMSVGSGSPYLYLVYKTAKKSWRPIAGVSSRGPVPKVLFGVPSAPLPRHPTHMLQSLQVQQLSQVMKTLKLKSQNGQLQGRGGAYWVIESRVCSLCTYPPA